MSGGARCGSEKLLRFSRFLMACQCAQQMERHTVYTITTTPVQRTVFFQDNLGKPVPER